MSAAVGAEADLLVVALDVTDPDILRTAVTAAVQRFGRIDLLINNAGTSSPGRSRRSPISTSGPGWRQTSSGR